ncbi:hypothetical protein HY734_01340 [Candidatus Uhrbacteria bacterium]|nr:hypothetical protein [Candidatus Uhrbacteria bacterium]
MSDVSSPPAASPDQIVEQAVQAVQAFEREMDVLEANRQRLIEKTIKDAEGRAVDRIHAWLVSIFSRLTGK